MSFDPAQFEYARVTIESPSSLFIAYKVRIEEFELGRSKFGRGDVDIFDPRPLWDYHIPYLGFKGEMIYSEGPERKAYDMRLFKPGEEIKGWASNPNQS